MSDIYPDSKTIAVRDILRWCRPEEIKRIMKEALDYANSLLLRKQTYGALFDEQMQRLRSRGCTKKILKLLIEQRETVLVKAAELDLPENGIPFLPVIPLSDVDVHELMNLVTYGKEQGRVGLSGRWSSRLKGHCASQKAPHAPYFAYYVRRPSSSDSGAFYHRELSVPEGIAYCIHSKALSKTNIILFREVLADFVIALKEGVPELLMANDLDDEGECLMLVKHE